MQYNARVKDCVGDMPSLPQDSKVEPAIQEAVWTRHEGTMSESMMACKYHGFCFLLLLALYSDQH